MSANRAGDGQNVRAVSARDIHDRAHRKFRGDTRGNFRGESGKPPAFEITQDKWTDIASHAMREHVGDDAHAAKRLSRILECSPRTAQNYLLGQCAPSGIHFLRAYAMIPEFTAEVRRLTDMEASLDPEFERDLANFLVRADRHMQARRGDES